MSDNANESNVLTGCNFDADTASVLNGKNIIALVTDKTGADLLAVAGQQGLTYNMESETNEVNGSTKDTTAGWTVKFSGSKSWNASISGLYSPTDEATQRVAKALANGEYLCLKICERTANLDGSVTYQPLRMGIALVTSDNFEAPNDEAVTYSMNFEGSGAPWLYETATSGERTAAKFTIGDCTLSALTLGSLTLSPTFDKDVTSYTAETTQSTNTVTATATDSGATVVIKNGNTTVTSGSSASWSSGENTVTITVTNGGNSKVYTVVVTKS